MRAAYNKQTLCRYGKISLIHQLSDRDDSFRFSEADARVKDMGLGQM